MTHEYLTDGFILAIVFFKHLDKGMARSLAFKTTHIAASATNTRTAGNMPKFSGNTMFAHHDLAIECQSTAQTCTDIATDPSAALGQFESHTVIFEQEINISVNEHRHLELRQSFHYVYVLKAFNKCGLNDLATILIYQGRETSGYCGQSIALGEIPIEKTGKERCQRLNRVFAIQRFLGIDNFNR